MLRVDDIVSRAWDSLPEPMRNYSPSVGLILGSGLAGLVERLDQKDRIDLRSIADFPHSTAPDHKGRLVFGMLGGVRVACFQGRLHLYEGWEGWQVALPVYLLQKLGVQTVILTNASGSLNPDFEAGDIMLIDDHINLTGANPLRGVERSQRPPYFPDMSKAYAERLRRLALEVPSEHPLRRGIYIAVAGPSFETSAERRYLRSVGGDAVGMSTVLETIAANHCGLEVLAFSGITNTATGGSDQPEDSLEEVLATADQIGERLGPLIEGVVARL